MSQTWTHVVVAHNTATDSTNRIHSDEVAREFGFRGGLVPGVDVWAYAIHPCVDRWDDAFLERGRLALRFDAPTYDGDTTTATLDEDGGVQVTDPSGAVCASGSGGLDEAPPAVPDVEFVAPVALDERPAASETTLAAGTALGTLTFTFDPTASSSYVADVRETDDRYVKRGISHPGFHARLCNTVLWRSVELGPWIHVGTEAHHLGVLRADDAVEVRARVTDEYERKGHRFVRLDVVVVGADAPVYVADHTAIWRPRGVK